MFAPKTYIHLNVGNANRSSAFYQALLGGPPVRGDTGLVVFDFDSPPLVLTLEERGIIVARPRPANDNASCFSLVVTDPEHVGTTAIALRRAGVRLRLEDGGVSTSDPDGNAWKVSLVTTAKARSVRAARH